MILPGSYANGFAPRDGEPLYPELWRGCVFAAAPCLGPTGTRVFDHGAKKCHADVAGTGTSFVNSSGRYGLSFNGSGRAVSSGTLQNNIGTGDFAFASWVNRDTASSGWTIACALGSGPVIGFYLDTNTTRFGVWSGAPSTSTATIAKGVWNHICATRIAGTLYFYLNGIPAGSNAYTFSLPSDPVVIIGSAQSTSQADVMRGNLDDLRIYNRGLSVQEVKSLSSRRGIAYELAPVRYAGESLAAYTRRLQYAQLVGGGLIG